MEKILKIEDTTFKTKENDSEIFVGYQIITDQQTIKVGISNEQHLSEDYGYLIANDEIEDFIGANLISVSIVDTELNNKKIEQIPTLEYGGGTMFVNLETSNGILQLVAYNAHNGWYGHDVVLISNQLNHNDVI